jgi:uncharacterized protein Yka (UPF0111/DUF47 family)
MGVLDRMFNGGEYKIMQEIRELANIASRANSELIKLVESSSKDIRRVKEIEEESDSKVFQLSNLISSGAVSPNVLSDMLALVQKEDDIVDAIFNLARGISRYTLPDKKMAARVKRNILATTDLVNQALDRLSKMEASGDVGEINAYRKDIEVFEKKEDEIKDELIDYIYGNDMDFKTFHYVEEIAHKCDDILDNCEDSADIFMSIMVSIMT